MISIFFLSARGGSLRASTLWKIATIAQCLGVASESDCVCPNLLLLLPRLGAFNQVACLPHASVYF